jgi:hypothetical protein
MSNYVRSSRHPLTGEWDDSAMWIDDYFGHHAYGVKFSDGDVFNPREHEIETREVNLVSVELEETTPNKEITVTEDGTGRKDVVVQVNSLDVEVNDEATQKAKEVIEHEVIPKLASAPVLVTVAYRHPIDGQFLYSAKVVKVSEVRKYAEKCVEAFIEQFKLDATSDDFMVVEYYKGTDEVRITKL